jgi:VCBS repeat-containing protein
MDENGIFAITANGQVSFTNGAVNFESQSSYTVTVKVTDNGTPPMETVQDVTVSVRNTNDAPTLEESGKNTTQRNHSEPHTS